ncbi:MAG: hypothetical protein P4L50_28655 [Anaerolineaceae bacterium]|nr:hypothetical protein [Anaerolineaceae bacterium]
MPTEHVTLEQELARRRRGGQRGNHNALKHGFYAHQFNPADLKDLEKCEFSGLADEIALLRVQIRRLVALSEQDQTLAEAAFTLRVLSLAALAVNRLVRTQHAIGAQGSGMGDLLSEALHEMGMVPGGPYDTNAPHPQLKPS